MVSYLEFGYILSDLVDDAGNVITLIDGRAPPLWHLPVFRIATRHHDFDDDLVILRDWNIGTDNLGLRTGADHNFEHSEVRNTVLSFVDTVLFGFSVALRS